MNIELEHAWQDLGGALKSFDESWAAYQAAGAEAADDDDKLPALDSAWLSMLAAALEAACCSRRWFEMEQERLVARDAPRS